MSIVDIIECSESNTIAARRVSGALVRREMKRTQQAIADTFSFSVTWGQGVMNDEQIARYQVIWKMYGDLVSEVHTGTE